MSFDSILGVKSTEKCLDTLLAEELNRLTIKERDQVYFDIHGVSEQVVESSELIAKSLIGMENELSHIQGEERVAYDEAINQNATYKQNEFRLMFLIVLKVK